MTFICTHSDFYFFAITIKTLFCSQTIDSTTNEHDDNYIKHILRWLFRRCDNNRDIGCLFFGQRMRAQIEKKKQSILERPLIKLKHIITESG